MVSGRDDRPYLFLSYARTPKRDPSDRDDPDRWVYKLYKDLQFDHTLLGERYCTEGFYGIMKLQNYRADYLRAVHRLAERIIAIGDESVPFTDETAVQHAARADFDSPPSAFGPASVRRTADGRLQIAVLAHDTSTLPPGRSIDYYGPTPHTWSPYRPEYPQPLADYAQELAKKCLDFKPLVGAFEGDVTSWTNTEHPGTTQPVPGGPLGEPLGQALGTTQSAGLGGRALSQRAGPLEQPGHRGV